MEPDVLAEAIAAGIVAGMSGDNTQRAPGTIPGSIMGFSESMLPQWALERERDFFVYSVAFAPIAAGDTQSEDFAVQNDSDFFVIAQTMNVRSDAAPPVTNTDPQFLYVYNDAGSGRNAQNRPVHVQNVLGTAQRPFYLPNAKFIERASTITTQLQSLETVDFNVIVSYAGFKVFDITAREAEMRRRGGR